jgi:uncharacterized membrane protein (DUF373 family)
MRNTKTLIQKIRGFFQDSNFLIMIHLLENLVSKFLSLALIAVIVISLVDLILILSSDLFKDPFGFFNKTLIEIFGLFLNILIALELLENITSYLKKHIIQVELVMITALIAVARKLIIFDFNKNSYQELLALGIASIGLSASYWLLRQIRSKDE